MCDKNYGIRVRHYKIQRLAGIGIGRGYSPVDMKTDHRNSVGFCDGDQPFYSRRLLFYAHFLDIANRIEIALYNGPGCDNKRPRAADSTQSLLQPGGSQIENRLAFYSIPSTNEIQDNRALSVTYGRCQNRWLDLYRPA
jgi:hypothetical protein